MSLLIQEAFQAHQTDEALMLLAQYGDEAKLLAGGTDLIIQLREGHLSPRVLIDISSIIETGEIKVTNQAIEIGATACFTKIEKHPLLQEKCSAVSEAARSIGSPQIRNRATIGGNICNASPAADILPPLLALDASAVLKTKGNARVLPLSELITGNGKTVVQADEMLERVRFSQMPSFSGLGFSKLGIRNALAIARLSMAVYLEWDGEGRCLNARIASGALGIKADREWAVESFMRGKRIGPMLLEESAALLEKTTVQRLAGRKTLPFKRHAVKGVFREAVSKALKGRLWEGQE